MQNLVNSLQGGPGGASEQEKQGARTPSSRSSCRALTLALHAPVTAAIQELERLQVKDTLRMINSMVELCFSECVTGFRSKALSSPEEKCIGTCAEKFLKHSGRVGQRFGELWMQEQAAQQAAGAMPP